MLLFYFNITIIIEVIMDPLKSINETNHNLQAALYSNNIMVQRAINDVNDTISKLEKSYFVPNFCAKAVLAAGAVVAISGAAISTYLVGAPFYCFWNLYVGYVWQKTPHEEFIAFTNRVNLYVSNFHFKREQIDELCQFRTQLYLCYHKNNQNLKEQEKNKLSSLMQTAGNSSMPAPSQSVQNDQTKEMESQIFSLNKTSATLRSKIEELESQQKQANEDTATLRKENEQLKNAIAKIGKESDTNLKNLHEMTDKKTKLEEYIEKLNAQIKSPDIADDDSIKKNLSEQLAQAHIKLSETLGRIEDLDKANIQLIEQLNKLEDQSEKLKKAKNKNSDLQNKLLEAKTECERLTAELEASEAKLLRSQENAKIIALLKQEIASLKQENVNLANLADNLNAELTTKTRIWSAQEQAAAENSERLSSQKEKIDEIRTMFAG